MHVASVQHRDSAPDLIESAKERYPSLFKFLVDGGYAGEKLASAISRTEDLVVEIAKRSDPAKGFVLFPKRWVVGRTFGWLGRCCRLAKAWEATIAASEVWLLLASNRRMTTAIARARKTTSEL